MYDYIICMKSGKEYKITTKFIINELIDKIMPKNMNEFIFSSFSLADNEENIVAIIGNEISSIEFFVKKDNNI